MYKLLILFLLFVSTQLSGQRLEVIGGININSFYDNDKGDSHFSSSYTSKLGSRFAISIEGLKLERMTWRFTLGYDQYQGEVKASDGSLGGGYTTTMAVEKSAISLGIYPLNLKIKNRIDFNLGMEISTLISEKFQGKSVTWRMGGGGSSTDLEERYDHYNRSNSFGLSGRLAYDIQINESLFISPQYQYYLGFSSEFKEFPEKTKSMRHYFSIGLEWAISQE